MMKVIWITNMLLPEATARLTGSSEIKGSGGWLLGLANELIQSTSIDLFIVSISSLVSTITKVKGEQITYFAIPSSGDVKYEVEYEESFRIIFNDIHPDIVHIHGTEFPHSLAALRAFSPKKTVVSIQGLVSVIARYYFSGLTTSDIVRHPTFHDLIRKNLFQQKREMKERGQVEKMLLKESVNVIGRTSWDYCHTLAINPSLRYFHCDEILRQEFYDGVFWSYSNCDKYSIFLSQGSYPIKGLHLALKAFAIVKQRYPTMSIRIAGSDFTYSKSDRFSRLKISSYGRIIRELIMEYNLADNISFLGPLNAIEMKNEYIRSNVFICPSSIENSPNSLCEAQILGVPLLASYVGGIPDLMRGDEEHLYRYDEVEMLAVKICKLFELGMDINTMPMRTLAMNRHNKNNIAKTIINIYNEINE